MNEEKIKRMFHREEKSRHKPLLYLIEGAGLMAGATTAFIYVAKDAASAHVEIVSLAIFSLSIVSAATDYLLIKKALRNRA